jgi:hypothetical protein
MFWRLFIFSFFAATTYSCTSEYKKCNCSSKNEELKAYSEILNEIVDHRSYNYYLGEDEERIFKDYVEHPADTIRIQKEIILLQNKIFNDTTRFCNLYLDTIATRKFNSWIHISPNDTSRNGIQLKNAIREISNDIRMVLDTAGSIQTKYFPKDFMLCTSRMKMNSFDTASNQCSIGVIRLSKIAFNAVKNKGLLYYEFVGRDGNLLLIEKVNGRWIIKMAIRTWIV